MLVIPGNRNKDDCPAGWGVVAVFSVDDKGTPASTILCEMCGPVVTAPSEPNYFGAEHGN